jgi:hypothetical protein
MQTSDYESMVTAQANPPLPGERLGSLGRAYDAKPEYLFPGLLALGIVAYKTYLRSESMADAGDRFPLLALVAGGLLTQAFY